MEIEDFERLNLVGGTALALILGHRESNDIDLFGAIDFDLNQYGEKLNAIGEVKILSISNHINILSIDGIKIDIVNYRYPWIEKYQNHDNIRLASLQDIGAMKLNAIAGRGSRKDFIDIYFLLKIFSIVDLFKFYQQKFDDGNLFLVKKSLAYFVDADKEPMPIMIEKISWETIKDRIQKESLLF